MRQVPQYLIIGNGRVARHFQYYFQLLQLPFKTWHRQHPISKLNKLAIHASHILILINDTAIEEFVSHYLCSTQALKVHFSGSLISHAAYGAHPLTTFHHKLYNLEQYQNIPFILEDHSPDFTELLPGLPNPYKKIPVSQKSKYHALCVLAGNFSCMLWQKLIKDFEEEFKLSKVLVHTYLQQITQNLIHDHETALTGPLIRQDQLTITNNILALEGDPFQAVYKSFVTCYQKIKGEEHEHS